MTICGFYPANHSVARALVSITKQTDSLVGRVVANVTAGQGASGSRVGRSITRFFSDFRNFLSGSTESGKWHYVPQCAPLPTPSGIKGVTICMYVCRNKIQFTIFFEHSNFSVLYCKTQYWTFSTRPGHVFFVFLGEQILSKIYQFEISHNLIDRIVARKTAWQRVAGSILGSGKGILGIFWLFEKNLSNSTESRIVPSII
ncbi:hypothetical protein SFRURICE_006566 [Spodoptera frugiperda]|nr:hypothetical protein SFRURICE_006566 [Spodoptera frugiperda]